MKETTEQVIDKWQLLLQRQILCLKQGKIRQAQSIAVEIDSLLADFCTDKIFSDKIGTVKKLYQQASLMLCSEIENTKELLKQTKQQRMAKNTYRCNL